MADLVKCRVTGRLYDPDKEFIRILNSEPVKAQLHRMKNENGRGWGKCSDFETQEDEINDSNI